MTFSESLDWLYSTQQFGIKLGLENTARLLEAVGNPHERLRFIHVAGTNGKGSVCAMLDSVLRADGRRVGLYTSPHLIKFQERIRIDGDWIEEADVAEGLTRLREAAEGWPHAPTFFELATVLAILRFADAAVEVVVLETGMGGRLDSTNIVNPLVSVITPIAMDHSRWLGGTLAEIAGEKAGIIKPGVPVVSAGQEPEAERVIREQSERVGADVKFVSGEVAADWIVGLAGSHQRRNAALALAALRSAGLAVDGAAARRGISEVRWPGRFQRIGDVVLDGAHNLQGARQLVETWRAEYGDARPTVIFGALDDKDHGEMLAELAGIAGKFFFVPIDSARGVDPNVFAGVTEVPGAVFESLERALEVAGSPKTEAGVRRDAEGGFPDDHAPCTLVAGSLFLVGEALELLTK